MRSNRILNRKTVRQPDAESMPKGLRLIEHPLIAPRSTRSIQVKYRVDEYFAFESAVAADSQRPINVFGIAHIGEAISRCDLAPDRVQMIWRPVVNMLSAEIIAVLQGMNELARVRAAKGNHSTDADAIDFWIAADRLAHSRDVVGTHLIVIIDEGGEQTGRPLKEMIPLLADRALPGIFLRKNFDVRTQPALADLPVQFRVELFEEFASRFERRNEQTEQHL